MLETTDKNTNTGQTRFENSEAFTKRRLKVNKTRPVSNRVKVAALAYRLWSKHGGDIFESWFEAERMLQQQKMKR